MVSVRQIEVCRRVNVWIQGHLVVEDFFSFELGGCGPGFGGVMAQHPRRSKGGLGVANVGDLEGGP